MTSSENPQRFHDYLSCLQEEFGPRSKDTSSPRRFSIYLGNLKGEFELLSLEIESLTKERDEYKERGLIFVFSIVGLLVNIVVEMQMKKLQDVGRNFVCEKCSMGTTSSPQIPAPSKPETMKTTRSLFSTLLFQAESLDKLSTSTTGDPIQETTTIRSTQPPTLFQKLYSMITPTQPSQSCHDQTLRHHFSNCRSSLSFTKAVRFQCQSCFRSARVSDRI